MGGFILLGIVAGLLEWFLTSRPGKWAWLGIVPVLILGSFWAYSYRRRNDDTRPGCSTGYGITVLLYGIVPVGLRAA